MKRTPLRRVSKNNWWQKLLPKLKLAFARVGITTCERRGPKCFRDNYLGFAHTKKRRNITTEEDRSECALLCGPCHDEWELLPEEEMAKKIREIIAARPVPVKL